MPLHYVSMSRDMYFGPVVLYNKIKIMLCYVNIYATIYLY